MRSFGYAALLLGLFLAGCAGEMEFREGKRLVDEGRSEEGLAQVGKAMQEAPENREYRNYYFQQRQAYLNKILQQGDLARRQGRFQEAEAAYKRVLTQDSENERAQAGLELLQQGRKHQERLKEAEKFIREGKTGEAENILHEILSDNPDHKGARLLKRKAAEEAQKKSIEKPSLKASLQKPISMEFRDASIRAVFELLSRTAGVNFVFDRDVKPDLKTTLFVKDSTVEDVIHLVLVTNQLEQKILNDNSILIYPNTPAKQKEYQDLMVKSFYLTNVDAKQVMNTLKTLLKAKDVTIDEKLNYVAIRDTPEVVRLAEKLVANEDKPEPEVILELEVLEVGTNRLMELGIRYPEQVSASFVGTAGKSGTFGLNEWKNRDSRLVQMHVTDPAFILNLKKVDTETNLLANPKIRVRNREKAKVHIGEKVSDSEDDETLLTQVCHPLHKVIKTVFKGLSACWENKPLLCWQAFALGMRLSVMPWSVLHTRRDNIGLYRTDEEIEWLQQELDEVLADFKAGQRSSLPDIPPPWDDSLDPDVPPHALKRSEMAFLWHIAPIVLVAQPLQQILGNPEQRQDVLNLVQGLVGWTILDAVPPGGRQLHHQRAYEWGMTFMDWCAQLTGHLTADEAEERIITPIAEVAEERNGEHLLEHFLRSFILHRLGQNEVPDETTVRIWGRLCNTVIQHRSARGACNHDFVSTGYGSCVVSLIFAGYGRSQFEHPWPALHIFTPGVERWTGTFGTSPAYFGYWAEFMLHAGRGLLPSPALGWLHTITLDRRDDGRFWQAHGNGDKAAALLSRVLDDHGQIISEHTDLLQQTTEVADYLVKHGVRLAAQVQQRLAGLQKRH